MAARSTMVDSVVSFLLTGLVLERNGRREDVSRLRLSSASFFVSATKMARSCAAASFSCRAVMARSCASSFFSASLIVRSYFLVGSYDRIGESLDEKSESLAGVTSPAASMRQMTPV